MPFVKVTPAYMLRSVHAAKSTIPNKCGSHRNLTVRMLFESLNILSINLNINYCLRVPAYLRPETAQGTITNYDNVRSALRLSLPFGNQTLGSARVAYTDARPNNALHQVSDKSAVLSATRLPASNSFSGPASSSKWSCSTSVIPTSPETGPQYRLQRRDVALAAYALLYPTFTEVFVMSRYQTSIAIRQSPHAQGCRMDSRVFRLARPHSRPAAGPLTLPETRTRGTYLIVVGSSLSNIYIYPTFLHTKTM